MSINPPSGPVPTPVGPPYPVTGPGPARAHVRRLRQDGGTYRAIAAAAGLAPATVYDLDRGRARPNRGTTTAVLAVTSKNLPRGRVDAGGSRLRLRALHVMGHGSARIARALGVREIDHPPDHPRRRPHRQPQAPRRHHRPLRRLVGQTRTRPHSLRTRRRHRRPQTRHRRQLVRRRRPRRRPARHPRLPPPLRLETRHRHRRRHRHPPFSPPPPQEQDGSMSMDRHTHRLVSEIITVLERHGHHARRP